MEMNKRMKMEEKVENSSKQDPEIINLSKKDVDYHPQVHNDIKDLSFFQIEKILHNNSNRKSVCLQGSFRGYTGVGLVILEKSAFEEQHLKQSSDYFSEKSGLHKLFHNDIYGNYECSATTAVNPVKTTVIHPATPKHIEKFSIKNAYLVEETPNLYNDIVLKHITQEQFDLQWVYNILEHKSEVERIVFEDPDETTGFVLLPDLKWNGKTLENLYLLAIIRLRGIKSLRDLNSTHLPLLLNIKNKATETIKDKYGLDSSQLRIYLHYQPSFYHLHVHFTYLKHEAPGIFTERSHMLTTVISNITLLDNYYQQCTLPFVVHENDKLFKTFEEKGILSKVNQLEQA